MRWLVAYVLGAALTCCWGLYHEVDEAENGEEAMFVGVLFWPLLWGSMAVVTPVLLYLNRRARVMEQTKRGLEGKGPLYTITIRGR